MMTTPHERPHQSLPLVYVTLALANAAEAVEVLSAGFILNRATDDTAGQAVIAAGVFVGMLVGGFVSGAVSDTVGRVPALRWSLALAALAAAAADCWWLWHRPAAQGQRVRLRGSGQFFLT